jgi:hypothetical protein
MSNDDNIRTPDPIIRDKLIDQPFELSEEDQLKQVLEFSEDEYNNSQDINERKFMESLMQESKVRINNSITIKQKLNKMLALDKQNIHIYETLLSVIEFYIEGWITRYIMNKEEYNKTFQIVKTIRLTKEELTHLQKLFIMEE